MNTIYALVDTSTNLYFYVGQTTRDPQVRFAEHQYGAKTYKKGDENKYLYASLLDACGVVWTFTVLAQIETEKDAYNHDDVEDYYVNQYRHHPLQNMRGGNSEPWFGTDYNSVQEMVDARTGYLHMRKWREELDKKTSKVKKQAIFNAEKMLYSFEKPQEKFISDAFLRLKQRARDQKR